MKERTFLHEVQNHLVFDSDSLFSAFEDVDEAYTAGIAHALEEAVKYLKNEGVINE